MKNIHACFKAAEKSSDIQENHQQSWHKKYKGEELGTNNSLSWRIQAIRFSRTTEILQEIKGVSPMQCPRCKSTNVKIINYLGTTAMFCNQCSYDERSEFDESPQQKTSQKAKGGYAKYKTGRQLKSSRH